MTPIPKWDEWVGPPIFADVWQRKGLWVSFSQVWQAKELEEWGVYEKVTRVSGRIVRELEGPLGGRPWPKAPGNLADATQELYQIRTYCQVITYKWFLCLKIAKFLSAAKYASGTETGLKAVPFQVGRPSG
jgi:hypothetical protein